MKPRKLTDAQLDTLSDTAEFWTEQSPGVGATIHLMVAADMVGRLDEFFRYCQIFNDSMSIRVLREKGQVP